MNLYETIKTPFAHTSTKLISFLILAALLWALGAPSFLKYANAAQMTSVSDTITDSDLSVATKHVITFTKIASSTAGQTIKIQLDPVGSAFSQSFSGATTTDITVSGMTHVANAAACAGATDEVYATGNYNGGSDENLTFTVCAGDEVAPGAKTVTVGAASTNLWTNPASAGSYRITIGGTSSDSGETRVMVIDDVVVTASVDTTFTFTIAGLAADVAVGTTATTTDASATTTLAFGTMTPGVPKILGQKLTVATNARNGFVVTVVEDQNLTSSTGADIDLFNNGATTSVPISWQTPSSTIDADQTYGHIGLTSNDTDLNSGEFNSDKYVGNFNTARQVFSHTGPANGTTQNKGLAYVGYKMEIGSLQEAGTDYTNTLTYVATPTF